ncbi:MAG: phosphoribosylformylglycinamidine synthase I [Dehalococcoidia bacterium]|nr:phosphoribosylformylglycinamidine synthase I [Dehalococcoidia bacterium]MCK4262679.1 phosphoribosylformylglycinamidine synthase I [Dehalococcoidia bacterium]
MGKAKVLILRTQGTNCDVETAFAFEQAGGVASLVHIGELIRDRRRLNEFQIMAIPGGFTYGDDLGAGRVLANEVRLKLGDGIQSFVESGRLILGICNGFQVLVKAGILPEPVSARQQIGVTSNDSGRFECRWVHLRVNEACPCLFTKGIERLYLPVAHGEGKVVAAPEMLAKLRIALYYVDELGNRAGYPHNPNGSVENIAGICDDSGRIFALMPHPERHISGNQHPQWTRQGATERGDGFRIFANAVEWAQGL